MSDVPQVMLPGRELKRGTHLLDADKTSYYALPWTRKTVQVYGKVLQDLLKHNTLFLRNASRKRHKAAHLKGLRIARIRHQCVTDAGPAAGSPPVTRAKVPLCLVTHPGPYQTLHHLHPSGIAALLHPQCWGKPFSIKRDLCIKLHTRLSFLRPPPLTSSKVGCL